MVTCLVTVNGNTEPGWRGLVWGSVTFAIACNWNFSPSTMCLLRDALSGSVQNDEILEPLESGTARHDCFWLNKKQSPANMLRDYSERKLMVTENLPRMAYRSSTAEP
jgi:hypothetical protein